MTDDKDTHNAIPAPRTTALVDQVTARAPKTGLTMRDFLDIGILAAQLEREQSALKSEIERLTRENESLRGLLGNSAKDCPYCGLPALAQAKCKSGFPGCARADDQMLSPHYEADAQGRNHLYEQGGVYHACVGARMVERDAGTYLVWTLCEKDVPADQSFKSRDLSVTCAACLEAIKP